MRRDQLDAAIREAVRRTELAIGEIVTRDKVKDGVVIDRRVVNPESIQRAVAVYVKAQQLIGKARLVEGTAYGEQREDRPFVRNACQTMADYWREIEMFRVLAEK